MTTIATWNGTVPSCKDIEPPHFLNCTGIIEIQISDGLEGFAVPLNIGLPLATDNSGYTIITSQPATPRLFYSSVSDFLLINFTVEDRAGWKDTCSYKFVRKGTFFSEQTELLLTG